MLKLIGMKLRKVDCQLITLNFITAKKAGLKISVDELESDEGNILDYEK